MLTLWKIHICRYCWLTFIKKMSLALLHFPTDGFSKGPSSEVIDFVDFDPQLGRILLDQETFIPVWAVWDPYFGSIPFAARRNPRYTKNTQDTPGWADGDFLIGLGWMRKASQPKVWVLFDKLFSGIQFLSYTIHHTPYTIHPYLMYLAEVSPPDVASELKRL